MRLFALLLILPLFATAADWPTYLHDASRSGITSEKLVMPLKEAWVHRSPHKPRPAWLGPAKGDPYNKKFNLHNRQAFDHAYHVIVVGDSVLYGSSADDQIYCLDAKTGRVRWTYFTEGPIRLAPSFSGGNIFFGSDDGYIYCVSLSGKQVWKTRLAPRDYRIAGNGRIISAWPVRSGVLVDKGVAYAAAGMFPSEGVYIYALDSTTGKIQWKKEHRDERTAQGNLLLSADHLYVPSGRSSPVEYERKTGKQVRVLGGLKGPGGNDVGGTDMSLSGDYLVVREGRGGALCLISLRQNNVIKSFAGTKIIITPEKYFIHGGGKMKAVTPDIFNINKYTSDEQQAIKHIKNLVKQIEEQRENARRGKPLTKPLGPLQEKRAKEDKLLIEVREKIRACKLWERGSESSDALIFAGDMLFAGGKNIVSASNAETGVEVWAHPVQGRALGLAVANGRLLVSTDEGKIHCFQAKGAE